MDSLKQIARFYAVTVDDLLSGEELLDLARDDHKQKQNYLQDLVFGSLDLCAVILLILPIFASRTESSIQEVSLFALHSIAPWLKVVYILAVIGMIGTGILTLALQNSQHPLWTNSKRKLSLVLNGIGILLFVVSLQPYAAVFLLVFAAVKVLICTKMQ